VGIALDQIWLIPVVSLVVLFGSLALVGLRIVGKLRFSGEKTNV
jgi:hypothetical protein